MTYSNLPKSKLGCHASLEQTISPGATRLGTSLSFSLYLSYLIYHGLISFHPPYIQIISHTPLQPYLGNAYAFQPWSKYLHAHSYGKRTHLNDYFGLEPLCNCIYLFTNSGYPSLCADLSIYLVYFSSFLNNSLNMNCIALSSINVHSENSFIWCISQGSPVKQKQQVLHTERERFSSRNCLIQP